MSRLVCAVSAILALLLVVFTPVASANPGDKIRALKNEEIVLGDRDDYIRIYNFIKDQNKFKEKLNFHRDYKKEDNIAVCDVNGDGISEIVIGDARLVVPTSGSGMVHIYDKNGNELAKRYVGYEAEDDLACGDVDGDGKDEIVVGDSGKDRALIIQVGKGEDEWATWTASFDLPHGFWGGDRIAVGDVNGDGKAEIVAADTNDDMFHIYQYTGGGGEDRGVELKTIDVKFEKNDWVTIQYDEEDEITCGDVNGDGIDEIIYGNGYDTNRIYVYDFNGSKLFEFDAYFDAPDELAAGDINMDGRDEIIVGDKREGKIFVYVFDSKLGNFKSNYTINVDYEDSDGLAVGDIDGDSMVIEEVGCQRMTIPNQVVLVINAPPKHIGINYNENDPYYTDFYVEYKNKQGEETSFSVKAVEDIGFSTGFTQKFDILVVKSTLKFQLKTNLKWEKYRSKVREIEIASGLITNKEDFAVVINTEVEICEFKILKPDNMAVINGEQQYMYITKPTDIEKKREPLKTPYDYSLFGLTKIHTLGDILTYPDRRSGLVNYTPAIFTDGWEIGHSEHWAYYSEEITSEEREKFSTSLKTSVNFSAEAIGTQISFSGRYGTQQITTAILKTTEKTDFRIYYKGGVDVEPDKRYKVEFVLYKDSGDGHLVLDWIVTNLGLYYKLPSSPKDYIRSPTTKTGRSIDIVTLAGDLVFGDTPVSGGASNYIHIENYQKRNGEIVEIPIKVVNAKNIRNMDIELKYDPSIVRVVNVTAGSLTQDSLFEQNVVGDTVKMAFVDNNGINGNGSLAVVVFEVTGSPGNETSLLLSATGNDMDEKSINFGISNGLLRVVSEEEYQRITGDVNGNGIINSVDALLALEMAVGKREVDFVADINGDERVTSFDAAKILDMATKYTAQNLANLEKGYHPGLKEHTFVDYSKR